VSALVLNSIPYGGDDFVAPFQKREICFCRCFLILADELERKKIQMNGIVVELEKVEKDLRVVNDIPGIQLKEVERLNKEIENNKLKMKNFLTILNDLNSKKENLKKLIENAMVISVIVVDGERNGELQNGLISLNRDVLMKLVKIVKNEELIKNVEISFCLFFIYLRSLEFQK
jgi:hypothetical protein